MLLGAARQDLVGEMTLQKSSQILTEPQGFSPYSGKLKVVHEGIDVTGTNFTGEKQISGFSQKLWLIY